VRAGRTGRAVTAVESFDAFVLARSRKLTRTAYLLTQDHALAEDLVQTALAKAWFSWSRIEGGDPEPYVRRIMVNTYATWWRRRWNGEQPTEELPEPTAPDQTDAAPDRTDLWHALQRLPRRQRAVVVLRYYEDLSEAETAKVLGCSTGTVKSQTAKAFAKLRLDPALLADLPAEEASR
jgi:RNA polymerase sigma-70 factor (sigma-E family)